jgi:hypothetical protein
MSKPKQVPAPETSYVKMEQYSMAAIRVKVNPGAGHEGPEWE